MDVYEALYTTRAMRKLKPDPIAHEVQARILDAAIRAPSGGNAQRWRFLFVDDQALRNRLGEIYRACAAPLWEQAYGAQLAEARANPASEAGQAVVRLVRSAQYLAEHFEESPLLLFAFHHAGSTGSSIYPAIWSAMLAARAEGVGSCLTTILEHRRDDVHALLGVPPQSDWQMACCVTLGYPQGPWSIAARQPAHEVAFRNRWDEPIGFEIPKPLWSGHDR